MRYLVYGILSILLVVFILLIIAFGIDKSVAQRDYEKAVREGNYEQAITGCLFKSVCDDYTRRLWK